MLNSPDTLFIAGRFASESMLLKLPGFEVMKVMNLTELQDAELIWYSSGTLWMLLSQLAGAVEYTDCTSAEG